MGRTAYGRLPKRNPSNSVVRSADDMVEPSSHKGDLRFMAPGRDGSVVTLVADGGDQTSGVRAARPLDGISPATSAGYSAS
jgi:hypothetical protein